MNRLFSRVEYFSILLASNILLFCIITSSYYAYGDGLINNDRAYGLTYKSVCLIKNNDAKKVAVDDIVDPKAKGVLILNEDIDNKVTGIFDPNDAYKIAFEETNRIGRYLTTDDYLKGTKVVFERKDDIYFGPEDNNAFYYITPMNNIYNKDIDYVVNLFSQKYFFNKVYVDNFGGDIFNDIVNKLKSNGYVENGVNLGFFHNLFNREYKISIYTSLFYASLCAYCLFLASLYKIIKSHKDFIDLNIFSGKSFTIFVRDNLKNLLILIIVTSIITLFISLFMNLYLANSDRLIGKSLSISLGLKAYTVSLFVFVGAIVLFSKYLYSSNRKKVSLR